MASTCCGIAAYAAGLSLRMHQPTNPEQSVNATGRLCGPIIPRYGEPAGSCQPMSYGCWMTGGIQPAGFFSGKRSVAVPFATTTAPYQ